MARKHNVLNGARQGKVYEWFKKNRREIIAGNMTKEDVAAWAARDLKFPVTASNIEHIAGSPGKSMMAHNWNQGAGGQKKARELREDVETLAQVLSFALIDAGITLPEELQAKFNRVLGLTELNIAALETSAFEEVGSASH